MSIVTFDLELPDAAVAAILTPEGRERARVLLSREFAGIDLDAVTAIRESFDDPTPDLACEEAFDQIRTNLQNTRP